MTFLTGSPLILRLLQRSTGRRYRPAGMRVPVKSERDAFRLTFGSVGVVLVAVALGALINPWAGVALSVGGGVGILGWELAQRDPDRATLRDVQMEREDDGRHRILVIANQTVAGDELRQEIIERGGHSAVIRVVAPVLPSRAHYVTSDIDRELGEA